MIEPSKATTSDRLVAPAPAVQFADDETAATILTPIRQTYDTAVAYVAQQQALAEACQGDIDRLRREIEDRKRLIDQRELERQAALQQVQRGQAVAKGAADTLALLGAPVPPAGGELSHAPDEQGRG